MSETKHDPDDYWVCDGCMATVVRDQIADMCDGEHVICHGCDRDLRARGV